MELPPLLRKLGEAAGVLSVEKACHLPEESSHAARFPLSLPETGTACAKAARGMSVAGERPRVARSRARLRCWFILRTGNGGRGAGRTGRGPRGGAAPGCALQGSVGR